jgi:exopolysaccharide production protein ExoQ
MIGLEPDNSAASVDEKGARGGQSGPLFWMTAGVLAVAFFAIECQWHYVFDENAAVTDEYIDIYMAGGTVGRQLGLLALGGWGAWLLARGGPRLRVGGGLSYLVLAALAWCLASVLWSDVPAQTARRLVAVVLTFLGALGTAKHFSARELCLLAAVVGGIFAVLALASDLSAGSFRPFGGEYRLSGIMHPNSAALCLAALLLAVACLAAEPGARRILPAAGGAAALGLLLLTRSRTALFSLLLALGAIGLVRMSPRARVATLLALAALACGLVLAEQFIGRADRSVADVFLLGREEGAGELSGRTPLWQSLGQRIMDRPWLGYGYQGFWTLKRYDSISEDQEWPVHNAHSAYLEVALGLGLVGAALVGLVLLAAAWQAGRRLDRRAEPAVAFIFGMLVLGAAHGLAESALFSPIFVAFLLAAGILRLAFFQTSSM